MSNANGWQKVLIGDVCRTASGGTPSRSVSSYWGGSIPWITTSKINYSVITDADEFITMDGLEKSSAKIFPAGTLLLAPEVCDLVDGGLVNLGGLEPANQTCEPVEHCRYFHNGRGGFAVGYFALDVFGHQIIPRNGQ